MLELYK